MLILFCFFFYGMAPGQYKKDLQKGMIWDLSNSKPEKDRWVKNCRKGMQLAQKNVVFL